MEFGASASSSGERPAALQHHVLVRSQVFTANSCLAGSGSGGPGFANILSDKNARWTRERTACGVCKAWVQIPAPILAGDSLPVT